MTKIKALFIAVVCSCTLSLLSQEPITHQVHLGLVTPISTQGGEARNISPSFSLQILQGINQHNNGLVIAGLYTKLYGSNRGVLISGLANRVLGSDKGVTIAGLYNNAANGLGIQIAGLHNYKSGNGYIQIAGLSNYSRYTILQIGGLINVSKQAHHQVVGLVNIAQSVKGLQIAGLINVADSSDYPIGLFNFIKNGEQQIGVQLYDDASANIVLRTGGRKTYGIIGAGVGSESNEAVLQMETGLGYHIPLRQRLRVNAEAVYIAKTDFIFFKHTQCLRALLGCRLSPAIEVTAGPAIYTYRYSNSKIFSNNHIWKHSNDPSSFALTGGLTAGINVNL